jgi:hypothetical protein
MQKEDVLIISHLLSSMKDAVARLEVAEKRKDNSIILEAKREILKIQKEIASRL